jgi:hypothetical protein
MVDKRRLIHECIVSPSPPSESSKNGIPSFPEEETHAKKDSNLGRRAAGTGSNSGGVHAASLYNLYGMLLNLMPFESILGMPLHVLDDA